MNNVDSTGRMSQGHQVFVITGSVSAVQSHIANKAISTYSFAILICMVTDAINCQEWSTLMKFQYSMLELLSKLLY